MNSVTTKSQSISASKPFRRYRGRVTSKDREQCCVLDFEFDECKCRLSRKPNRIAVVVEIRHEVESGTSCRNTFEEFEKEKIG